MSAMSGVRNQEHSDHLPSPESDRGADLDTGDMACRVVLCTCPDDATAGALARRLVQSGLAACVNQLPGVRSTYRWEGQVMQEDEVLLVIKTTTGHYPALEQAIHRHHPYDTPEVIALPVVAGLPDYLDWLRQG